MNVLGLEGTPDAWAQQLARIATHLQVSTPLVGLPEDDPIGCIRRLGEDIAPAATSLWAGARHARPKRLLRRLTTP